MENDRPSAGLRVLVCMILVFLVVPVFVAVPMAFSSGRTLGFPPPGFSLQHFARLLSWEGGGPTPWPSAIFNSLSVGFVSAALAVALGTPAAVGLRRLRGAARGGLTLFFVLPMVTPIIVSSIAFYLFFIRLDMAGSFAGLVLAHASIAAPFVVLVVNAALEGVDPDLERAAESLGATPGRAVRTVLLPIVAPAMVASFLLAFVSSLDEIVIALFLGGTRNRTLPVKMFDGLRFEFDPTVTAAGLLMLLMAIASLVVVLAFQRGRAGSYD